MREGREFSCILIFKEFGMKKKKKSDLEAMYEAIKIIALCG